MVELPSGTVTFLFTDLEVSTRLWEREPDAMRASLARHDVILREVISSHGGHVVKGTGDGVLAVFPTADAGVLAAVDAQSALGAEAWVGEPLRVRMGLHTGVAELREGDYFGSAVNRAARLMATAHGGQIVCSQSTADLARQELPDDVGLADLGEHRLRDLTRADRVFQVNAPGSEVSFPPLCSLESYPTNLPAQMKGFVGREAELRNVAGALAESRVVMLTGVGGVGKTRLALQVAAEVLPEFPDGAFMVELGGLNDANAIDESIAAALFVQQQPGQTITESLLSFLGTKRLLLVLDNCEHLLESVADLVSRMLTVAPHLKVLATSREALRIDGEQVLTVPSLEVPDDLAPLELLAMTESVRLFVDRAHATRAGFALSAENAPAVTQLCRRLDGIPLAIELAAARVRSMAPAEIAARLDQRFRLLTGGSRTAASRHQTLRGAIDWSYDALEPAEQVLLARLAVCVGGFDLAAAEVIGAGGAIDALDIDDAVGRLVEKSLVHAMDLGRATRYKMLETIREYASERLDASGETAEVRTRHVEHYTEFAQQAGAGLKGPDERAWLERVEDELDNLRAAVTWSLASGEPRSASRCVCALGLPGIRIERVVATWADSIVASDEAGSDAEYAVVLATAAWARTGEGRIDEATQLCDAALQHLTYTQPSALVFCRVMAGIAGIEASLGRSPAAHAAEGLRAAQVAGDDYEAAVASNLIAVGQLMAGDPAALATAEESLRLARRCASPTAIAYCLLTTATVCGLHDPGRALSLLDESQRAAQTAGNAFAFIAASGVRSQTLARTGDLRVAAAVALDVAREAFRYGRREQQANYLSFVAATLAIGGNDEPAAVISGWAQSVLIPVDSMWIHGLTQGAAPSLPDDATALADLPEHLGDDRYALLQAQGAAMPADEILEYAHQHLEENS